jgi:hypothetical protein
MGYVNDTNMKQFISPFGFGFSAGTWTPTISSELVSNVRSQADASVTILIPIPVPSNSKAFKGAKLASVDIWYAIATAAADDFATAEIVKQALGVDDTVNTGSAPAVTLDTGHDTAAERLAVDTDHRMTITLDTPVWIDDNDAFFVHLVVDCAATTDLILYGAQANYTFRA